MTSSVSRVGLDELAAELRAARARDGRADADGGAGDGLTRRPTWPSTRCSARPRRGPTRYGGTGEGSFRVTGAGVERLLARYDLDNEEALAHLERRLRGHRGAERARGRRGSRPGDEVEIAGVAFDLDPDV